MDREQTAGSGFREGTWKGGGKVAGPGLGFGQAGKGLVGGFHLFSRRNRPSRTVVVLVLVLWSGRDEVMWWQDLMWWCCTNSSK